MPVPEVPDGAAPRRPGRQPVALTGDRWEELKSVFGDAAELPPGDRAAFLDARCGSDAVLMNSALWGAFIPSGNSV
jgi:hypothetical protein